MATQFSPKQNRHCALAGAEISPDELEFMNAVDAFKRRTGKAFPLWSEVLVVVRSLGYRKVAEPERPERKGKAQRKKRVRPSSEKSS